MIIIDKTGHAKRSSRKHDYEAIDKASRSSDPDERRAGVKAKASLKREHGNKDIRSMRDALIKAHRKGDKNEIKDIHDIVSKNKKYQNE